MIRAPAARELARRILSNSVVRMPVTEAIVDAIATVIMQAVALDELRQRSEKKPEGEPHG